MGSSSCCSVGKYNNFVVDASFGWKLVECSDERCDMGGARYHKLAVSPLSDSVQIITHIPLSTIPFLFYLLGSMVMLVRCEAEEESDDECSVAPEGPYTPVQPHTPSTGSPHRLLQGHPQTSQMD
jgi:hypothetical protein